MGQDDVRGSFSSVETIGLAVKVVASGGLAVLLGTIFGTTETAVRIFYMFRRGKL